MAGATYGWAFTGRGAGGGTVWNGKPVNGGHERHERQETGCPGIHSAKNNDNAHLSFEFRILNYTGLKALTD